MNRSLFRKFIALLCATIMMVSTASGYVYAEEFEVPAQQEVTEQLSEEISEEVLEQEEVVEVAEEPALDEEPLQDPTDDTKEEVRKKKITVMAYLVASNLETGNLGASLTIADMMYGILEGAGEKGADINFVIETGGSSIPDDKAKERYDAVYANFIATHPGMPDVIKGSLGYIHENFDFTKNERWILTPGDNDAPIKRAQNDQMIEDGGHRTRTMTAAGDDKVNPELREFIDSTVECYPADEYMLFFYDHGGGANTGFGVDERESGVLMTTDHIGPTMAATDYFGNKHNKLALVGYDACLMCGIEEAIAWSPYAGYLMGSEQTEGGDGWPWDATAARLCAQVRELEERESEASFDDLIKAVGQANADSYVDHFVKDGTNNATMALVDLGKTNDVVSAFDGYFAELLEGMKRHPLDYYTVIHSAYEKTRGYGGVHPRVVDILDFTNNIEEGLDKYMTAYGKDTDLGRQQLEALKKKGDELEAAIKASVVYEKHSEDMDGSTGLCVYLELRSVIDQLWTKYRIMMDYGIFETELYSDMPRMDNYIDLVSLIHSIYASGKQLNNEAASVYQIENTFNAEMQKFGLGNLAGSTEGLRKIPEDIFNGRLRTETLKLAEEGGVTSLMLNIDSDGSQFADFEQKLVRVKDNNALFYGSVPGGNYNYDRETGVLKQPLYSYGNDKWFVIEQEGQDAIVAPVAMAMPLGEDRNVVSGETLVVFSSVYPGLKTVFLIMAYFPQNSDKGEFLGFVEYNTQGGILGRFYRPDQFTGMTFDLVGNLAEFLDGAAPFDAANHDRYKTGTMSFANNPTVRRNVSLAETGNDGYVMSYFARDIFDNYVQFGSHKQKVYVKFGLKDGIKKQNGDNLSPSELQVKLYAKDKNGKDQSVTYERKDECKEFDYRLMRKGKKPADLFVDPETGNFIYYNDSEGDIPIPLQIDNDTAIALREVETDTDRYKSIGGANVRIDKVFNLVLADPSGVWFGSPENKGKVDVVIDPVAPVHYNGTNLVTTTSTKTGSKVIGLAIHDKDDNLLCEGVDYTVSYKNNKNVADPTSEKPPTMTIKGKDKYKGLSYVVKFTILPADFSDAGITVDRLFTPIVKNTKKGIDLKTSVLLSSGVKVPENNVEIHYYLDGQEVSTTALSNLYNNRKVYEIEVEAKAFKPDKAKVFNYVEGSITDRVKVYAYGKEPNALKIRLNKSAVDYVAGNSVTPEKFINRDNIKTLKAGKTEVSLDNIKPPVVYYDKKLTDPVPGNVMTDAGTYYIAVEVKDDWKPVAGSFKPDVVTVRITGKSLPGKAISLKNDKIPIPKGSNKDPQSQDVVMVLKEELKEAKVLKLACTTRDKQTVYKYIYPSVAVYENGKANITVTGIDNGAPGSYKITVYGLGGFTGSKPLSYKVVMK